MIEKYSINTNKQSEMIHITHKVRQAVQKTGIQEGIAVIYCPHTTAGITINEGADPDVVHDILMKFDKTFLWKDKDYLHAEGNSAAHIKASCMGSSDTIPITGGQLLLGTWQSIYFCEFDGPRHRTYYVKVIKG
ncbi:secondary thiamine-phosphate synthase enzyme YjbQ [Acetobacterium sp.]|uniref:secondary thiamine-phosphate synthase enzyme YjbQ n=1 Tax=Acetobacterium sp. TaxID=1872094 RepID=UPI002F419B80